MELKRTGFAFYFEHLYQNWTGRYAFLLANGVHPLRFGGLQAYQLVAGGLVVSLISSCYLLGYGLTSGSRTPWAIRLELGSGLVVAVLVLLPSPAEGFYWVLGGYNYLLPVVVGLAGFAACCSHAAAVPGTRKHRIMLLGALGAAALFPGYSEFSACLALALAGGLLLAFPHLRWAYRGIAATAVVGAVLMLAAPGNVGRLQQQPHEWHILHGTVLALGATAYTLVNWLAFPVFWALALLGMPIWKLLAAGPGPIARATRNPLLWPLLLVVGLTGCYLFSYLAIQQPPPLRARNLLYAYFLVTGLLGLIGAVQCGQRLGWKAPKIPAGVLLLFLAVALLADGNGRLRNAAIGHGAHTVALAYRDWLSGDAGRFDAAERRRYALLRATVADSVAVPPLTVTPVTLFYYDIGLDPSLWGNKVLALYFGKKAVWVQPGVIDVVPLSH